MKFSADQWTELSEQQQAVIKWVLEGSGSLELMARAGCGKTYTLMKVVKAISAANLGDIAIMAYNKKIADELKEKIAAEGYSWQTAQAGTVHSFAFNAWRKLNSHVKIDNKKLNNIVQDLIAVSAQAESLIIVQDAVVKMCSLAKQRALGHLAPIENTDAWMDIWEHFGIENDVPEDFSANTVIALAKQVYKISLNQCRDVIDFDDMILAPLVFKVRFWTKDWILVDESQDTNPARRALALAMLKPKTGRMIFVGDPAQAIYGFTGADSDSMSHLKSATSASTLPLNVTRRCPKNVVKEAQRLVPDFVAHESAIDGVVRTIQKTEISAEKLTKYDAILCRNTSPLVETAYSLISTGTACKVEGREIGTGLIKLARRWKIKTLDKLVDKLSQHFDRQYKKFAEKDQLHKIQQLEDQIGCLNIMINKCLTNKKTSVDDLVFEIEGLFGNTPEGQSPQVLTLSTGHKSKGREFKRVYLLDMQKYCPSPYAKLDWQVQQERNLEYVMITRAMSELVYVNS